VARFADGNSVQAERVLAPVVANFESLSRLKRDQLATLKWFMNERD